MLNTLGAIVGPTSALCLLGAFDYHYPSLFAFTLVPGLLAVCVIVFLVAEKQRSSAHPSRIYPLAIVCRLPAAYRQFLVSTRSRSA
jgi:hypothetical protein